MYICIYIFFWGQAAFNQFQGQGWAREGGGAPGQRGFRKGGGSIRGIPNPSWDGAILHM